ncbi:MAG: transporter [Gemmatimonadota bacterium]|nr:MAG: transporter [Gemmatimonadota bacterium]
MMDHTHELGEFVFSYRYMYMQMNGLRIGTEKATSNEVLNLGYSATPTDMQTQMHMLAAMFAPIENFTLVAMLPFAVKSMDHATRSGPFTTESSGVADLEVAGMWKLEPADDQLVHLDLALSFPNGSTEKTDGTPMGDDVCLPYPVQIGSGTFDLTPGLTCLGQASKFSWGLQGLTTFRLGENDQGYRFGHRYMATTWGAYHTIDWLSGSLRLDWTKKENVEGADSELDPDVVPTADPDLQGFNRWSAGFGINTYIREGSFRGLRINGDFVIPFDQDLNDPQLETDRYLIVGLQYSGQTGWLGG